ncbi:MAG: caspase family protein, partial [Bryobacteraceae bacterium]
LLAEIFAGKRPKAVTEITEKDRRLPVVRIAAAGGTAVAASAASQYQGLTIAVWQAPADRGHARGSGVRDLRLFRNGSLVKMWHGAVRLDTHGRAVLHAEVRVVAGENHFTAYAFNHDNIKSADADLNTTGADALKHKGTAYLLAIGVDHYSNSSFDLKYAGADAQDFAQQVRQQQEKLGNFEAVPVISLLDAQATRANILEAFARLAGKVSGPPAAGAPADLAKIKKAQPEDAVFIFFAGHGMAEGARFYLIPHDLGYAGARDAIDKAAMKLLMEHGISDQSLDAAFEGIDAGQMALVIDACNSGQALEAEEKRRGPMNSRGLAQLAYEKGMYILTAAQGYQQAQEINQLGHGLLTYALVEEGLKQGKAAGADGNVYMRGWLDYAVRKVPQLQWEWLRGALHTSRAVRLKGGATASDPAQLGMQRPRVFYRRDVGAQPFVVGKPAAKQ